MEPSLETILSLLKRYVGKNQLDLCEAFSITKNGFPVSEKNPPSKNVGKSIVRSILKASGFDDPKKTSETNGLSIKNITVNKNGHIMDALSFSTFRFLDLAALPFQDTDIYKQWRKPIIIVVWRKDTAGRSSGAVLHRVEAVQVPEDVLNTECRKVYEMLVERVSKGECFRMDHGKVHSNLPSSLESRVCHVRPKAKTRNDMVPLPVPDVLTGAVEMTKQCFWLNKEFVADMLRTQKSQK